MPTAGLLLKDHRDLIDAVLPQPGWRGGQYKMATGSLRDRTTRNVLTYTLDTTSPASRLAARTDNAITIADGWRSRLSVPVMLTATTRASFENSPSWTRARKRRSACGRKRTRRRSSGAFEPDR